MKTISFEVKAGFCAVLAALLTVGGTLGAAVLVSRSTQEARNVAKANASPVIQPVLVTQGAKLFALNCSHCHADDATGDEGPRSPWPDQIRSADQNDHHQRRQRRDAVVQEEVGRRRSGRTGRVLTKPEVNVRTLSDFICNKDTLRAREIDDERFPNSVSRALLFRKQRQL